MMKTRFLCKQFLGLLLCFNLVSCSDDSSAMLDEPTSEEVQEYVQVGLSCVGENLDITESPLSRAISNETYCIQILSLERTLVTGHVVTYETPYAFGIFKSLEKLKVRLLTGTEYRFLVAITSGDNLSVGYNTEFQYSSVNSMNPADSISVKSEGFYGELDQTISGVGSTVNIPTRRVSYGVKVVAEGLKDGILRISVSKSNRSLLYHVDLTSNAVMQNNIYSFSDSYSAWKDINYSSEKYINVNWLPDASKPYDDVNLGEYKVTFKRNVCTTIKVKADESSYTNGITVTKEDAPILPDDNEVQIQGGGATLVPVK